MANSVVPLSLNHLSVSQQATLLMFPLQIGLLSHTFLLYIWKGCIIFLQGGDGGLNIVVVFW